MNNRNVDVCDRVTNSDYNNTNNADNGVANGIMFDEPQSDTESLSDRPSPEMEPVTQNNMKKIIGAIEKLSRFEGEETSVT